MSRLRLACLCDDHIMHMGCGEFDYLIRHWSSDFNGLINRVSGSEYICLKEQPARNDKLSRERTLDDENWWSILVGLYILSCVAFGFLIFGFPLSAQNLRRRIISCMRPSCRIPTWSWTRSPASDGWEVVGHGTQIPPLDPILAAFWRYFVDSWFTNCHVLNSSRSTSTTWKKTWRIRSSRPVDLRQQTRSGTIQKRRCHNFATNTNKMENAETSCGVRYQ